MTKKQDAPLIGTTLRLSENVIDGLDAYRRRLQERTPGLTLTISDAARVALLKAFDIDEDDE
jgi:hypothetical protein